MKRLDSCQIHFPETKCITKKMAVGVYKPWINKAPFGIYN